VSSGHVQRRRNRKTRQVGRRGWAVGPTLPLSVSPEACHTRINPTAVGASSVCWVGGRFLADQERGSDNIVATKQHPCAGPRHTRWDMATTTTAMMSTTKLLPVAMEGGKSGDYELQSSMSPLSPSLTRPTKAVGRACFTSAWLSLTARRTTRRNVAEARCARSEASGPCSEMGVPISDVSKRAGRAQGGPPSVVFVRARPLLELRYPPGPD
jgi:hypothetical protein